MPSVEIQCLCGASVVRIKGDPMLQFFCHCDDCQATSGGSYVELAVFAAEDVEIVQDSLVEWTLKTMPRQRCRTCGTHMTATVAPGEMTGVKANLLPTGMFKPSYHQQCQYAVLPIIDRLPHYKQNPPDAGGTDERVDW